MGRGQNGYRVRVVSEKLEERTYTLQAMCAFSIGDLFLCRRLTPMLRFARNRESVVFEQPNTNESR
jgi:hypothetical protein